MVHGQLRWILLTASALLAAAGSAMAQSQVQKTKVHRVAYIFGSSPLSEVTGPSPSHPGWRAFVLRLREHGYIEGQNLQLDVGTLEGQIERSAEVVANLARLRPDVIYMPSVYVALRGLGASAGVPIVLWAGGGVVESGLAQSLARPGGTVTGIIGDVDSQVEAKRLEMLREVVPKARRIAYLGTGRSWQSPWGQAVEVAARNFGFSTSVMVRGEGNAAHEDALGTIDRERPDALFVPVGFVSYGLREKIGRFAAEKRIPCTAPFAELVEHGCLMSYGVNVTDATRRIADYVARILQGSKPGDLPIERPGTFELVINMKVAKAIGVTVPQTILLRADRVIE